ncbi:SWF/SNF helicase family protein [Roseibacterium beibuensis]|uniref:Helicase C-terminal domain-containing protein n=1 Tax=[Roseibacterium] beibuensis TaxID=1193142 RepID=A0ABP9LQI5_9RHOB|nr:C-terminal helicase domain-containing protein [Roseibacterium beibuensis]MCS6626910.1 SWF/SNF helicase family protein [Roseibacterium beibuensis]
MARIPKDRSDFQEIARVRRNLGDVKAPYATAALIEELRQWELAFMDTQERPKMVIFAHHKSVIETIKAQIEAVFPGSVLTFDGSTKSRKCQPTVDALQQDESKRVMILSRSGIKGITLIRANVMRTVEPDWNPADMIQLEDRMWRTGHTQNCDVGYMFIPGTLDGRMGKSILTKMESDERTMNKPKLTLEAEQATPAEPEVAPDGADLPLFASA